MMNGQRSIWLNETGGLKNGTGMEQILSAFSQTQLSGFSLLVSVLALAFSGIVFFRMSALNKHLADERDKLEKRIRIITSGAVGMGEKLVQLESRLADAVNGQLQTAESEAQFSYTQALKLIETGVDRSVVMSNSGLSESEVNLMELLHQSGRSAGTFSAR